VHLLIITVPSSAEYFGDFYYAIYSRVLPAVLSSAKYYSPSRYVLIAQPWRCHSQTQVNRRWYLCRGGL